tara:strand:- start:3451 stop:4065 length:615 start_codon:yes stop_codon:yes gene_type:complete
MIAIIDYGLGNINAIYTVYKNLNIPVIIASTNSDLKKSDKFILPGVGAFDYALQKFNASGMRSTLEKLITVNKNPILGICVGMQMLARKSEEGLKTGLDWIDGEVKIFDQKSTVNKISIPHMGWNNIIIKNNNPLFYGLNNHTYFYFLHSYYFKTTLKANILSLTKYGKEFISSINHENIYGVQFHPEKSHQAGIKLLKNFSEL